MYANGNVYKEAGKAVAYCSLLCLHRAILMQCEKQVAVPGPCKGTRSVYRYFSVAIDHPGLSRPVVAHVVFGIWSKTQKTTSSTIDRYGV